MLIFSDDKEKSIKKKVSFKNIQNKVDSLYEKLNNDNLNKFAEIITSPRRIFWRSFLSGVARGIGTAIGFSLLGAIIIYLLRYIVMLNIPVIGVFIKDILDIVQK